VNFKLCWPKETTRSCFWDYGAGHHPFKTLNGQLNIILGHPKGGELAKTFGIIKSFPLKTLRPKS